MGILAKKHVDVWHDVQDAVVWPGRVAVGHARLVAVLAQARSGSPARPHLARTYAPWRRSPERLEPMYRVSRLNG